MNQSKEVSSGPALLTTLTGPAWVTCASIIKGPDGSIFRVPCSQLQAVCPGTYHDPQGQPVPTCGFQCMRCFQVFQGPIGLNPDWRPSYTFDHVLPILPRHRVVFRATGALPAFPTDPTVPIWAPCYGHYCQAVYLVDAGDRILARCSTCGRSHKLNPAYYPTLQHVPGPLVPAACIMFAFQDTSTLGPPLLARPLPPFPVPKATPIPTPRSDMTPPLPPTQQKRRRPKPRQVEKSRPPTVTKLEKSKPFWDNEIVRQPPKPAPKVTPKPAPKATPKPAPKVVPKPAPKVVPKPAPKPPPVWTTITTRRGLTKKCHKLVTVRAPTQKKSTPTSPAVTSKVSPKPKPRKKKKKSRANKKAHVDNMDMGAFTDILTTFQTADTQRESRFAQDETRLEMAACVNRVKLLRQTFGSWKSLALKYRGTTRPLFLPTKDLQIMAGFLTHSYHRIQSSSFQTVYAHCEKHRLAAVADKDSVGVMGDLPVCAPSVQDPKSVTIKPLRDTEWFSPPTYLWVYFEVFWVTKIQAYYSGANVNLQNMFPRKTCDDAMCRVQGFQVKPCEYEKASEVTIDFHVLHISNLVPTLKFLFPTKLIQLLLKNGYTARQIMGFILLHFRNVFDTLITTKTMLAYPTFKLYEYVPANLDLAAAMAVLLLAPPPEMANTLTPNLDMFDREGVLVMSKSWVWAAVNFVNGKLQEQGIQIALQFRNVRTRAYSLYKRHMTTSFSNILDLMFTFGLDMAALAPTLRNFEYMSYLTFQYLHVVGGHGAGQGPLTTARKREFVGLVTKTLDEAVHFAQCERAYVPLKLDGQLDHSVETPIVNQATLNSWTRKHMHAAIRELHSLYKKGSSDDETTRAALLYLVRVGGSAGVQLLEFWLGGVPGGQSALDVLKSYVWLVRYYQAYGDDTDEVQVVRHYRVIMAPQPVTLQHLAFQHYRYQRAFVSMSRVLDQMRTVFTSIQSEAPTFAFPTRSGLSMSLRSLEQRSTEYMSEARGIVLATALTSKPDPDSQQIVTKLLANKDDSSVLPTSTLIFCYLCRYILGTQVDAVDPLRFLCTFEEVCRTSTPDEMLELRSALYNFFAKLMLFSQGLLDWSDKQTAHTQIKKASRGILTASVSVGNFWVHVLRDFTDPSRDTDFVFCAFDEHYTELKEELETVYATIFG